MKDRRNSPVDAPRDLDHVSVAVSSIDVGVRTMGVKELVTKVDHVLGKHDKGKALKRKELERIKEALEEKRAKYRERLDSGSSTEAPDQTELRLHVVEAQLAKLRELME
jgi:ABC-type hemin transport system substrate-binding protein